MRYVILRDDDTNALTPVKCLERLYRPFLERGLPVNLATIPNVRVDASGADGQPEGFLFARDDESKPTIAFGENAKLVGYLLDNPGFYVVQHGFDHSLFEFDSQRADDIARRLDEGTRRLQDVGVPKPAAFVAPYDRFSSVSLREAAKRFPVISSGWFELERLPRSWWPKYMLRRLARQPHWRVGKNMLLSHPGCLLSRQRPRATMLEAVKKSVASRRLTVLVTHWWEYFPAGAPDDVFIELLHTLASWLADQSDLRMISFEDVARGCVPLN